MKLSSLPIERPVATLMLLLSLMVLGAVSVFRLPLDFMPIVKEPEVDVEIPFPGSHPLEVLKEVVLPIEEELAAIPEVKRIRSDIGSGYASITAHFDWSVNIDLKKMEVKEAVERARPGLPQGIGHIRVEGDTGGPGNEILSGRISAERDLSESWELLDRHIRRPLERIKGVARVNLYGVEPQQVRIDLDLDALKRHGVRPRDLMAALDQANVDLDLGQVHDASLRYNVRSQSRFDEVETIVNLPLGGDGLRVKDVARVEKREPRLEYGRHLNGKFAVGIDVYREPSENTVATADRLMRRIQEIREDPKLAGIQLLVWNNAGREIRSSLGALRNAGIYGGFLAVFVLYFFLRSVRTTVIVAVAIPFSLLVTCGFMYLFGFQFNVLTMTGLMLGVGMLVDNAVVVTENIHRLQGLGKGAKEAALSGSSQVALAVLAATATTVIVWSWLFVVERNELIIYISQTAVPICISVCCSLVISLTFIPLAAARMNHGTHREPGLFLQRVMLAYRNLLAWTLEHRVTTLSGLVLLAATAAIPIWRIEKSGEPRFRQREVVVLYDVHDKGTLDVQEGYVDIVEAWLESRKEELGFENVYSFYTEGQGNTQTRVYLPQDKATEASLDRLRARLREDLPAIPGVTVTVGERQWWRRGDDRRLIWIALRGEDPEYLEKLALTAEAKLKQADDVVEVLGPTLRGDKEIRVLIDPERARSLGLTPREVADVVGFAFRGRQLRHFKGPHGEVEILCSLPEAARPGLDTLESLTLARRSGEPVPLNAVAAISLSRTQGNIARMDRQTSFWVGVEFDKETVTTAEAKERIGRQLADFKMPEGYSWDWGWQQRRDDENLQIMLYGVLMALGVVVLLMMALFESFSQPVAILITLPLAFFGAFWALWLLGFELDAVAFVGVIILIGVVVNNGIVMVDHVNSLRRAGMERIPALLAGCGDRVRPVLMTAMTTVFGLIPLALSGATVAGAYIDSIAIAVIGGLMTSTLFTLVALPVWYTAVEDLGTVLLRLRPTREADAKGLRFPGGGVLAGKP